MRSLPFRSLRIAVLSAALALSGSVHAAAQASRSNWTPPRTADGQPDIQGYWTSDVDGWVITSIEPLSEEFRARESAISAGFQCDLAVKTPARQLPPLIVDPPDGKVPFQPWAAARKKEITDNYQNPQGRLEYVDPQSRCLPLGVPRMNYSSYNGFQFVQTPGYVVIFAERNHHYRIIPLDKRPHVGSDIRLWMGDSRGHWDGKTLVVEATNFNDESWFDIVGTFHSDALRVFERYTVVDADTIRYEATVDDPKVFTRPWTIAFFYRRVTEKGYELYEYACLEGNRAVDLILGGASTGTKPR